MNVLILTNTWPCSSEIFIKNLVEGLLNQSISVTVLCKKKELISNWLEGVKGLSVRCFLPSNRIARIFAVMFSIPLFTFCKPLSSFHLFTSLLAHKDYSILLAPLAWFSAGDKRFEIIHCQFGYLGNIGMVLKHTGLVSGPLISSFRGSDISSYLLRKPSVYTILKETGDLFLPVCQGFADRLVSLGFSEKKIRVYHSAINVDHFPFTTRKIINNERIELLAAGRMVEKKGFHYAIEALQLLVQDNQQYRLTIVGDGPDRGKLEKIALSLGVADHVLFTGWMDQEALGKKIAASHVFVATNIESRTGDIDGIPNVIKEAMASGLPVVAFNHCGIDELIEDEVSGLLVPSCDTHNLAVGITRLLDNRIRQDICLHARKVIDEEYSMESQGARLVGLYRETRDRQGFGGVHV